MSFKLSDFNEKTQSQIRAQLNSIRAVEAQKPESTSAQTLVGGVAEQKRCVRCVVSLVVCSRRFLDDDNSIASLKPLRDAIAESLGIDDGNENIKFQYGQIQTIGEQGVIVRIETN